MQNNKTVIIFLVKFFGTYSLLFLLYSFYLTKNQKAIDVFSCAPITQLVAEQSNSLLNVFGFEGKIEQSQSELSINLFVDNVVVAKIIEGCNSISIIILFISFIVSFASGVKKTLIYLVFGSLLIYAVNILRIVVIVIAIYKYPQYQNVLHSIIFPSIIYGITFLLWFLWVQKFSNIKR